MNLADKTVVLTHATNTLGIALAKALDNEGASLLLSSNDDAALKKLSSDLTQDLHTIICSDINSEVGRSQLVNTCQQSHTSIDVLINNPLQGAQGSFRGMSQNAISEFINSSLTAPMLLTRTLLPQLLKKDSAQLVNIATLSASIGLPGFAVDSAGRFGLRGFSEALAREFKNTPLDTIYISHRGLTSNIAGGNKSSSQNLSAALKRRLDKPESIAKIVIKAMSKCLSTHQIGWRERYWIKMNTLSPKRVTNRISKQLPTFAYFAKQKTFLERNTATLE